MRPSRTRPSPQVAADPLARLYQQDLVQLPADEGDAIDGEVDFEEYETSDEEDGGAVTDWSNYANTASTQGEPLWRVESSGS